MLDQGCIVKLCIYATFPGRHFCCHLLSFDLSLDLLHVPFFWPEMAYQPSYSCSDSAPHVLPMLHLERTPVVVLVVNLTLWLSSILSTIVDMADTFVPIV